MEVSNIVISIRNFNKSEQNWDRLQSLLDELFESETPEAGLDELFYMFERYPEEDGFGVFWSILHGIESIPNYEVKLLESIKRKPTYFTVLMINRILNDNQRFVGGVSLVQVLKDISQDSTKSENVRNSALEYYHMHKE